MYRLTAPYERKFTIGRGSEQFYNEELHKIYESTKHLTDSPPLKEEPKAKLHRSIWHDERKNALKWWDQAEHKWRRYYEDEFKITENIMSTLPPTNPIRGELWLHDGVLCYYDGMTWTPVKALLQDGSQFSLDLFKNFLLISPLWKIGGTVVEDTDIKAYKDEMRKYLQGVLDAHTDSMVTGDGSEYGEPDFKEIIHTPQMPTTLPITPKTQLLVPNVDYARLFLDGKLDTDKYEEVTKVCIQYNKNDLLDVVPSLLHLNPGRMTRLTKRLVMIDRVNPRIRIPAANTEYYGFQKKNYYGDLLLPDASDALRDYTIVEDGILLSYNASQNYDYVLAITYEFSWMKTTGRMAKASTQDATNAYYVDKYNGPFNVFVDGYNYEDPYYETDGLSQTITMKENTKNLEVSILHVPKREYGYIRQVNIKGQGIIRPLRQYRKPLVFVNGEALSTANGDVLFDNGLIYVENAKPDMAWCIIDLHEAASDRTGSEEYEARSISGTVGGDNLITYSPDIIANTETAVLFIDGLLVKKEEVIYNRVNHKIDVAGGLKAGQSYILVEDKYGWLYDEKNLQPALSIGKFSDSLVYFNNRLICNDTAIDSIVNIEELDGVFNEVKCFKTLSLDKDGNEVVNRDYRIYNIDTETWDKLNSDKAADVASFAYSYENMPRSIRLLLPYTKTDVIQTYAFNLANAIEHPLIIKSIDVRNEKHIDTIGRFVYGANTLRVWCNGIRQYPDNSGNPNKPNGIVESLDGLSFELPEAFTGKVTYIIELPENNQTMACTMETLDEHNLVHGYINMYKTEQPMFPGRVTVYVNGVRQATDSFTVFDNHTLLINDEEPLIGNWNNYPDEKVPANNREYVRHHNAADKILVEVRQDNRQERTIKCEGHPVYDISVNKYDELPLEILEAGDEILIFADGLFFGATLSEGYMKNVARGVITIKQDEILSTLNTDEEAIFLKTHKNENISYLKKHSDEPYESYNAELTLEWR